MNVSVYHMSTVPKEGAGSPGPRVIDGLGAAMCAWNQTLGRTLSVLNHWVISPALCGVPLNTIL